MPNAPKWLQETFSSSVSGCNSSIAPDLISDSSLAWGYNITNRGGRPKTRPYFRYRMQLPDGHVQGVSYFSLQGGMGVAMIDGYLYRLRIGAQEAATDTAESVPLDFQNDPTARRVWMCQTVESIVVQDFIDNPIIYDGSTATRSNPVAFGVPRGKQMAYGNGRLWVATNDYTLTAGDIRTGDAGSELKFTETNYLTGGGTFSFPSPITALKFMPTTGTSDYGTLLVSGQEGVYSVRADVTARDSWSQIPSFISTILRHSGCAGQSSVCEVNQDLYWRDPEGGIRSIRSSLADESGAGNSPISYEVNRITEYDSKSLLPDCHAINFNNRLLMGGSPFINYYGGTSWKSLIALDFAPVSTMSGKASPEYDGEWSGLNITHMFTGNICGKPRAFAIACSDTGVNSLWEIMQDTDGQIADKSIDCSTSGLVDVRPTAYFETRRCDFGQINYRKIIRRIDLYISELLGSATVTIEYRSDVSQQWREAGEYTFCAQVNDPVITGETVHVWKNLNPQHRSQVKTFTIPTIRDSITRRATNTGFQFQFRVSWNGHLLVNRIVAHAEPLDQEQYASPLDIEDVCSANNVT